jgi:hypothetical protein
MNTDHIAIEWLQSATLLAVSSVTQLSSRIQCRIPLRCAPPCPSQSAGSMPLPGSCQARLRVCAMTSSTNLGSDVASANTARSVPATPMPGTGGPAPRPSAVRELRT